MFGIQDPWIWSAYLLCILSSALCIGYGLLNWNAGEKKEQLQVVEVGTIEESEEKK